MNYKIEIPEFEGPLDLLLHLIKQDNIDIQNICIERITKQYLECINDSSTISCSIQGIKEVFFILLHFCQKNIATFVKC